MKHFLSALFAAIPFFAILAQDSALIKRPRNYSVNTVAFADDRILDGIANKTIAIEKLSDADLAGVYASTIGSPPGSPWINLVERDMMSRPDAYQVLLKILRCPKHNGMRGGLWGWLSQHPNYPHADELLSESIKIFKSEGAELGATPLMGLANFIAYSGTPEDAGLFDEIEKAGGFGIDLARQRYANRLDSEKLATGSVPQTTGQKSIKAPAESKTVDKNLTDEKQNTKMP